MSCYWGTASVALAVFVGVLFAGCVVVHQIRTVTLDRLQRARVAILAKDAGEATAQIDELLLVYDDHGFFQ